MRAAAASVAAGALLLGPAAAADQHATPTPTPSPTRTDVTVQACGLWVAVWRDNGVLDDVGVQFPDPRAERPGPVRVNGATVDPATYVWGEGAWFTTLHDLPDADSVLIQYEECGAMIAEDGTVVQAPALAPSTDLGYAPPVETGTDTRELVTPAPAPAPSARGEYAGRVLKTD